MRRLLASLAVAGACAIGPAIVLRANPADAAVGYDSPYTFDQTYSTALRYVRVDLELKITEKDLDNGYILFEYKSPESGSRVSTGSIEIVRSKDRLLVNVQLPQMPRYHEQAFVDGLVKKLVAEHGEPVRKKPEPPPEPPDGGSGDAGDAGKP